MPELLLVGQVDDAAAPASGAAELYVLSSGFGASVGTDAPALVETTDVAPGGSGGRLVLRRLWVPFEHAASCTLRVTPIVDFTVPLTAVSQSYQGPTTIAKRVLEVRVARTCTYLRVRIEVTARTGLVRLFNPMYGFLPTGSPLVAAGAR